MTCFKHAQQLCLLADGYVRDLVQKDGARVRHFKTSDAIGAGVSKSAPHVTEQLTFKGTLRQRACVHRDHGLLCAKRNSVERLRDHFLAGAVLAGDHHVCIRGPDPGDGLKQGRMDEAAAINVGRPRGAQQHIPRFQSLRAMRR